MAPKIYAHVLVYTTMFGITSGIAIAVSKTWSKTEDEKNAELLDKYPELVRKSQDGKKNMQAFFNKMKDPNNKELDAEFQGVLRGGNGDIKRTQQWLDDRDRKIAEANATVLKNEAAAPLGKTK